MTSPTSGGNRTLMELPYFPISQVYKSRFGGKVVKVPVALAETCPNRAGIRGMKTCVFCDEHGSFAYPETQQDDLIDQIRKHRAKVSARFNANRFLVYFQAYTSTFTQLRKLRESFDLALAEPDVVGIVVGTRPDCLSEGVLRTWEEYAQKTFLAVEFGVQSFDDGQLEWMRRGHTGAQSIRAIERAAQLQNVDVGVHLIFGWPTETEKQIRETAQLCNELPISNVKLHNLHVLKGTALEEIYRSGDFEPIDFATYARRVGLFLDHLRPDIAVHRLAALASRWDELIAPDWTRHKMTTYQALLTSLRENGHRQGRLWSTRPQGEPGLLAFGREERL